MMNMADTTIHLDITDTKTEHIMTQKEISLMNLVVIMTKMATIMLQKKNHHLKLPKKSKHKNHLKKKPAQRNCV